MSGNTQYKRRERFLLERNKLLLFVSGLNFSTFLFLERIVSDWRNLPRICGQVQIIQYFLFMSLKSCQITGVKYVLTTN